MTKLTSVLPSCYTELITDRADLSVSNSPKCLSIRIHLAARLIITPECKFFVLLRTVLTVGLN